MLHTKAFQKQIRNEVSRPLVQARYADKAYVRRQKKQKAILDENKRREFYQLFHNVAIKYAGLEYNKKAAYIAIIKQKPSGLIYEGEALKHCVGSMNAEQENTSRRDNQMWSMKKRLEDGSSEIYKRTCYGYISGEKGELRIDPNKAMVVQDIFKWYLEGHSIIGIIKELEQSFTLSPSGKEKWSKHTIEKILRNEKYIGTVTAMKTITVQHKRKKNEGEENKYVIEDNHPSIITWEIFDAVQDEIARRSNIEIDENGQRIRKKNKYSSKALTTNR